uniref:[phosphatase 2A protein]-leucine-carboxy methyltransferase n=1 Tax=Phlebotomus papatasi TaxID=29031 RepID=A0A1B0GQG8_PHLPP
MLGNLRARGCNLAGVDACTSLETQVSRFLDCGWHGARAWDMVQVYQSLPNGERQRIERLEMLDEGELLVQLFQHYAITIAWVAKLDELATFPGNSQRRGSAMCSHPCDEAVIATNDDASECKRSAVRLGYWQDDYLGYFVKSPAERKAPEINRGYFARVRGVEICIEKFLHRTAGNPCQIINLGCGFDTLYWRLREAGHAIANFIELDFPTVTARKCYAIKRNKRLLDKIHVAEDGEVRLSPTDLHASNYHIMGVDLRNIDELHNKLNQAEIDYTIPTIFLAECVLVYIETQNCHNLLKWLAGHFPTSVFVNYEQVNMNDREEICRH